MDGVYGSFEGEHAALERADEASTTNTSRGEIVSSRQRPKLGGVIGRAVVVASLIGMALFVGIGKGRQQEITDMESVGGADLLTGSRSEFYDASNGQVMLSQEDHVGYKTTSEPAASETTTSEHKKHKNHKSKAVAKHKKETVLEKEKNLTSLDSSADQSSTAQTITTVHSHKHSCGKGCSTYDDDSDDSTYSPTAKPTSKPASDDSISTSPTSDDSTSSPTSDDSASSPTAEPTSSPTSDDSTYSPTSDDSTSSPTSDDSTYKPTATPTDQPSEGSTGGPSASPTAATTTSPSVVTTSPSIVTTSPTSSPTASDKPTTYYELESEYDDDGLYRLRCDEFDDDGVYPSHFCNYGDTKTCIKHVEGSETYSEFCGDTCSDYDMDLYDSEEYNTKDYSGASWAVVCGWEAVKHMNETCEGTFVPDISEAVAADAGANYSYATAPSDVEVDGEKMDACNLHAFCSVCSYDSGTKIHTNCEAHVDKYGKGALYDLTSFFDSLDSFWCTDDVQEAIGDQSFKRKYGA